MRNIEKSLQSLRDVYVNYPKQLESAEEELKSIEDEIQDILHIIEFASLDAIKRQYVSGELIKLRKRRRELKNEIELLEQVNEIHKYSRPNERAISSVIGKVRTTIHKQSTRKYKMKVRKDLQYLIK